MTTYSFVEILTNENYTWVTVSGGRTVHIQTPNSKTLCGADNCSTGSRRKGWITVVKNRPTCKRCLTIALKAQESK